jgi:hypothetical protein
MELTDALRTTAAIRDFTDDPVSDETVHAIRTPPASPRAAGTGRPGA